MTSCQRSCPAVHREVPAQVLVDERDLIIRVETKIGSASDGRQGQICRGHPDDASDVLEVVAVHVEGIGGFPATVLEEGGSVDLTDGTGEAAEPGILCVGLRDQGVQCRRAAKSEPHLGPVGDGVVPTQGACHRVHLAECDVGVGDEPGADLAAASRGVQDLLDHDDIPAHRVDQVVVQLVQDGHQAVSDALIFWKVEDVSAPHHGREGVATSVAAGRREGYEVRPGDLSLHPLLDVLLVLPQGVAHAVDDGGEAVLSELDRAAACHSRGISDDDIWSARIEEIARVGVAKRMRKVRHGLLLDQNLSSQRISSEKETVLGMASKVL